MRHPHLPTWLLAACLAGCLHATSAPAAKPLPPPVAEIRSLLAAQQVERAVDAADAVVEGFAGNADAWYWAGRAYARQAMQASIFSAVKWAGRTREAWQRAVAIDPRHLEAQLALLDFYRMAPSIMGGGSDKASDQVATIAALDPSLGKFAQASMLLEDDPPRAEALLGEALVLDANNRRARMVLAWLAMERKDWAAARAAWEPVLAEGDLQQTARYQLGKVAAVSGEALEQGLAYLDAFIAADTPDPELSVAAAQWRRGQVLEKLGRRDDAIAAYRAAVGDPDVGELARADLARVTGA